MVVEHFIISVLSNKKASFSINAHDEKAHRRIDLSLCEVISQQRRKIQTTPTKSHPQP